jgi:hypothetical protein
MVTKKDLIIAALATLCLTTTLFIIVPTRSASTQTSKLKYDPWKDINDDGKIDIVDIVSLASIYGARGTPINKTALLLELLTKITSLNASVVELQSRLDSLNRTINELLYEINSRYDVTIRAHCNYEDTDMNFNITKDGVFSGYTTPHTFWLIGNHTFTIPNNDTNNHPFKHWSTGSTNTTITISSSGEYIAYYDSGMLNVSETFAKTSNLPGYEDAFGLYAPSNWSSEVANLDWGSIAQGQTKSVTLYLCDEGGLDSTRDWMSWTTNNTLPSYLHLSMKWNDGTYPKVVWYENACSPEWIRNGVRYDTIELTFTLTVDSNATLNAISFAQIFELHIWNFP